MIQSCRQCNQAFEITDEDLVFYEKISPVFGQDPSARASGQFGNNAELIPAPDLCPDCRARRRRVWRNERALYNRKCDLCGKEIISMYSPVKTVKVYCEECYMSDKWEGQDFALSDPFSGSVFAQLALLRDTVPLIALFHTGVNENSTYTNFAGPNRNCYLVYNGGYCEDCYYCRGVAKSKNCMDMYFGSEDELCYECVNVHHSYNVQYSQNCYNCTDSFFLYDCNGCMNCFGCTNLRKKQYCIFNTQYSKEDYFQYMQGLGSHAFAQKVAEKFKVLVDSAIHRANQNINVENCLGDYMTNCKGCGSCFEVVNSEDCKFMDCSKYCKDSYDLFGYGYESELLYNCVATGRSNHCMSCIGCDSNSDLYYSLYCTGSSNLFGCIGLKHQQYCIFNRQYTKEEYERIVPQLIESMRRDGSWGQFFDPSLSPFGYNETVAQDFLPWTKEEALRFGFQWNEYVAPFPQMEKIIKASQLPDHIRDVPDDVLNWGIECEVTGKPYRVIRQELQFYRDHSIPIPRRHPDQRYRDRFLLTNPKHVFERGCSKCGQSIQTTYAPERKEMVYCESCYLKEVY